MTKLFPIVLIVASAGAAVSYWWVGDWRRAVYWAACTVINVVVTF